jgi:phosphopantothenoylcysteine decarboxylase/phosphopantothenate--cysteine ligase
MKKILLGVTGSIAAYKACELARLFVSAGDEVTVVMTGAAQEFVRPLMFQTLSRRPVYTDPYACIDGWKPAHIALASESDLVLIAPASADFIAKMRCGIADDLLSSAVLAASVPVAIAPAMNEAMWKNPATAENVACLKARGVKVIGPASGDLACGVSGTGRMLEPEEIFNALK